MIEESLRTKTADGVADGRLFLPDGPEPHPLVVFCMDASSPHLGAPHIRARCYFGVADQDRAFTPFDWNVLAAALQDAGVAHELELYPGALHGFAMSDMTVYDEAAPERHWDRVLALFGDALGTPA